VSATALWCGSLLSEYTVAKLHGTLEEKEIKTDNLVVTPHMYSEVHDADFMLHIHNNCGNDWNEFFAVKDESQ
jgi:hypothetical protein